MTQLELPPISFGRYLDLLKRRRWQVVPVSLLGLLIGGIVAFFIPRYYVSDTILEFSRRLLQQGPGAGDPLRNAVGEADHTIQFAVDAAVVELGWPEATSGSADDRNAFIQEVRSRVKVLDMNPRDKGRRFATVKVSYRDTDGERAKELTNRLVDVWIKAEAAKVHKKVDNELKQLQEDYELASAHLDKADDDLEAFQRQNIEELPDPNTAAPAQQTYRRQQLDALEDRLKAAQLRQVVATQKVAALEKAKLDTPSKRFVWTGPVTDTATSKQLQALTLQRLQQEARLGNITPNHPEYAREVLVLAEIDAQIAAATEGVSPDERTEEVNPQFESIMNRLSDAETDLVEATAAVDQLTKEHTVLKRRLQQLPGLLRRQADLQREVNLASRAHAAAQAALTRAKSVKRELQDNEVHRVIRPAVLSPAPTEPNIYILALAGSLVGLGAAIALILLLDILQTTFKTPDDVERLLPVPFLGGLSHMVTVEQRREVAVRRTKIVVVTAAALVLSISVITIYYVKPTSLPPVVRDTLGVILGSPVGPSGQ